MESNTTKFYSNRFKSGLLAIILFTVCYFAYTKLLADPYGITDIAFVVIWFTTGLAFIMGIICTIITFDPRPIVELMPEGIIIRTFIFTEDFVPWEEVSGVEQEQHTQRAINMAGYVKVTTSFLRIYRPVGRSLAINLTLLNKRGNEFIDTISSYFNNQNNDLETSEKGMTDERLLKKYHQLIQKKQKLDRENTSLSSKIIAFLLSILILLWMLNYFRTLDFNLITIIGFIVAFLIIWVILLFISEFIMILITNPENKKVIVDHQIENYRKIIRTRVEPEILDFECMISLPIIKSDDAYYEEVKENIHFNASTDEGQIEQGIFPKDDINIKYNQKDAQYKVYAKKVASGIFKDELIGYYRELNIPR